MLSKPIKASHHISKPHTAQSWNVSSTFLEGLYHRNIFREANFLTDANYIRYRFHFTSDQTSPPSFFKFDKTVCV